MSKPSRDIGRDIAAKLGLPPLELGAHEQLMLVLDTIVDVGSDSELRPQDVKVGTTIAVCTECGRWNYHRANCTRRPMP